MSNTTGKEADSPRPVSYQIKIRGILSDQWVDWFEGMSITPDEEGNTVLCGPIVDDAALHGLLKKVRDLGMGLLSVNRVEAGQAGKDRWNNDSV